MSENGIVLQWYKKYYLERLTESTIQDLIEKIKQESEYVTTGTESNGDPILGEAVILKKLIGDDKE